MRQGAGSLTPTGRPAMTSWLLVWAWLSPWCCWEHLGHEAEMGGDGFISQIQKWEQNDKSQQETVVTRLGLAVHQGCQHCSEEPAFHTILSLPVHSSGIFFILSLASRDVLSSTMAASLVVKFLRFCFCFLVLVTVRAAWLCLTVILICTSLTPSAITGYFMSSFVNVYPIEAFTNKTQLVSHFGFYWVFSLLLIYGCCLFTLE